MVFCHELAHIKHMNHIPSLHGKLDRELRQECRNLQARGYYGDGFWSAGQRLEDNAFVSGSGMNQLEGLPQYSCGGAYRRATKRKRTRRPGGGKRRFQGPSLHTGAQTAPNTKGGRRIKREMPGQGSRVDSNNTLPPATAGSRAYKDDPNSTFRKRATSQLARDLRVEAAVRRMRMGVFKQEKEEKPKHDVAQGEETKAALTKRESGSSGPALDGFLMPIAASASEAGSDSETETEEETDVADPNDGYLVVEDDDGADDKAGVKREATLSSGGGRGSGGGIKIETQASKESEALRFERARLYRQHERAQGGHRPKTTAEEWSDWLGKDAREHNDKDAPQRPAHHETEKTQPTALTKEKATASDPIRIKSTPLATTPRSQVPPSRPPTNPMQQTPIKLGIHDAIDVYDSDEDDVEPRRKPATEASVPVASASSSETLAARPSDKEWQCQLCTLLNPPFSLRCEACDTSRGSSLLGQ
ncbi:hypothetical protein ACQY0O_006178 [Thecaphora frezii]